ncbi:MAG: D-allose transporter substrate-binding protein [Actinobacteria bacterium]|nr:D-allose transporter substrate-binding protein [Actinomycetota bacterium]
MTAAAAATALMSLAACSGNATPAPTGGDTAAPSGDAKYAVVLKVLSSEFWQKMEAGVKDKAKELGVQVDVYAANSEDDVEGQVALAENLLDQNYAGIGVAPLTADNLVNVVAKATANGTPVINLDEKINSEALSAAGGALIGFITTDNVSVGSMGAGFIVDQLGGSGGQVAIIEGKAGTASGEARKQGATEAFSAAAGVELVDSQPADWDRTRAFDLATNYIAKYPDLKGIYCANDTMAMGAQEAVEKSGRDIIVVGTDGNADAIESVKAGKLGATVAQDSAGIGAAGIEQLVEFVKSGQKFDSSVQSTEKFIDAILITK